MAECLPRALAARPIIRPIGNATKRATSKAPSIVRQTRLNIVGGMLARQFVRVYGANVPEENGPVTLYVGHHHRSIRLRGVARIPGISIREPNNATRFLRRPGAPQDMVAGTNIDERIGLESKVSGAAERDRRRHPSVVQLGSWP
jgi:hypothetical protein